MYQIVLIRHGQSEWNKQNLFTGWVDVDLSEQGVDEAITAGKVLKERGYEFTHAYSSMLKRANRTLDLVLENLGQVGLATTKHWRLNERHYGALQGLNKQETREKHGDEQVKIWRRSFTTKPPQADAQDVPTGYEGLDVYPRGESLSDTCERVTPYWENEIAAKVKSGEKIIITAHGNSLRALIKHLENISTDEIVKLEIPTGKPILIKLDKDLNFIERTPIE